MDDRIGSSVGRVLEHTDLSDTSGDVGRPAAPPPGTSPIAVDPKDVFLPASPKTSETSTVAEMEAELERRRLEARSTPRKVFDAIKNFVSDNAGKLGTAASLAAALIPVVGPLLTGLGLVASRAVSKNENGIRRGKLWANTLSLRTLYKDTKTQNDNLEQARVAKEKAATEEKEKAQEEDDQEHKRGAFGKAANRVKNFVQENAGKLTAATAIPLAFVPAVGPFLSVAALIAGRAASMNDELGMRRYQTWPHSARAAIDRLTGGRYQGGMNDALEKMKAEHTAGKKEAVTSNVTPPQA